VYRTNYCSETELRRELCACMLSTDTSLRCQRSYIWGHHGICVSRRSGCESLCYYFAV